MSALTKKRNPWKRILLTLLILAVAAGGIYWYVATEKFSDTKDRKAAYTVSAFDFIKEFLQNDSAANAKYREKIVTINGTISALEAPDTATVNVKFVDPATGSYIIFAFQETHLSEGKNLKAGDIVSIKGSCSGGVYSEILEVTKIDFKRSTLNK
jgi:tRNA_anti-like